ncbi:putative membrane protein YeiH [Frondihabitans sp. PhB188]|uniref:trimeric intracellular cation channel family protein n=1 Tax=Frondihabitans sp. PhB188 TaxID=2485200 RepID=UPI000F9A3BCA|nr:TRIC cation channel family protein [Frondihabitans sp. PhB188]ROQ41191.1 putative membrane protein YeiH [Frondihabitans sp. PhB188]
MSATAFSIPLWADLLAVAIGSLQGALFASQFRERRVDLLGVAIIGTATGLGGGILRDVLIGEVPRAMQSNWYLLTAVLAALLGMLLQRIFTRLAGFITVLDALTIGLFGAIGSTKALALGLPEIPAVFVGVISAVGGSVLRDLLMNLTIAMMHVGSLYAVAAGAGTAVLVALVTFGVPTLAAAIAGTATTFSIRLLAVRFGWSLPEQRALSRLPRWRTRTPKTPETHEDTA